MSAQSATTLSAPSATTHIDTAVKSSESDAEYLRIYDAIMIDITNLRNYNFITDINRFQQALTKENVDPIKRGNAFYHILYTIGKTAGFTLLYSTNLRHIYRVFHTEILQLGSAEYVKLLKSLILAYPDTTNKLLLASPFIPESSVVFNKYNNKIRYIIMIEYLALQSHHFNTMNDELVNIVMTYLPNDIQLFPYVSNMINAYGKYYYPYDEFAHYRTRKEQLENIIIEKYPLCDKSADSNSIAFYMENPTLISADTLCCQAYIRVIRKLGYRVVVIHHVANFGEEQQSLFDGNIYIHGAFNQLAIDKFVNKRFRVVFYVNTSTVWAVYLASIGLGLTQVGLLSDNILSSTPNGTLTSGISAMDYFVTSPWDVSPYTETAVRLYGMGLSLTPIKPVGSKLLIKDKQYKYIYCPWAVNDITRTSMGILKSINDKLRKHVKSVIYVFYIMSPCDIEDYNARTYIIDTNINNYIVVDKGIKGYYDMMNVSDLVLTPYPCANISTIIDALSYKKPIMALNGELSQYAVSSVIELLRLFKLDEYYANSEKLYIDMVAKFVKDDAYRAKLNALLDTIDVNKVSEEHNNILSEEFREWCMETLELAEYVKPTDAEDNASGVDKLQKKKNKKKKDKKLLLE